MKGFMIEVLGSLDSNSNSRIDKIKEDPQW